MQLPELRGKMLEEQLCGKKRGRLAMTGPESMRSRFGDEERSEVLLPFFPLLPASMTRPPSLSSFCSILGWKRQIQGPCVVAEKGCALLFFPLTSLGSNEGDSK